MRLRIGSSGARSTPERRRSSLARSLGPTTKAASPVSAAAAAMARRSTSACAVSIIAQSAGPGPSSARAWRRSPGLETLGSSTASGAAARHAARSSAPHSVSRPLTRITHSRWPKPPAAAAWSRAAAFCSGATASSRSGITTSHARLRAFSIARAFDAGM
jgi:hypothetical protein